jgi:RNA polymerase sigma-70 factor (ECF subfamily)
VIAVSIEHIYREEWGRILAILIRLLGSFELAEEAAQEAFSAAVQQWPRDGFPANPRAWLVATARFKAIDMLRRQARFRSYDQGTEESAVAPVAEEMSWEFEEDAPMEDDRLRLIFTCCHPSLAMEAQVALTLRTLCGLTTEQIANAFLVPLPTMAQRLVRAKQKIRDAGIPYRTPPAADLKERLEAVLLVVYLVFNEGHNAPARGESLSGEAIRLGRLLVELLPAETEAGALLALMLLHHARRAARTAKGADVVLLEEQDRSLWNQKEIQEALALAESALRRHVGPYAVQAAIAAVHMRAATAKETDWPQIVRLYDVLLRLQPSAIIALNRAVAVAMAEGAEAGLRLLDALDEQGELREYAMLPAARGALLLKLERWEPAAHAYRRALALSKQEGDRNFLVGRLALAEAALS